MQKVNYAIQNGGKLSRASIKYFKHNDMDDLEAVLRRVEADHKKAKCDTPSLLCQPTL